jgi:hypothetical protein
MTWCLKNINSWNVDILPVLRHEAVMWVTCFMYWVPLLQMKCPFYPLNMSLLHLELNVPWARVLRMSVKRTFPTTVIMGQRVSYLRPFIVLSTWKEILWMVGGILISTNCYIPFQPPLAYVIQPKALVASNDYHMVVTTNIHLNRMARWLAEGTMYTGRGIVTAVMGFLAVALACIDLCTSDNVCQILMKRFISKA